MLRILSPGLAAGLCLVAASDSRGALRLVSAGRAATMGLDADMDPGVRRAATDLAEDAFRVTGVRLGVTTAAPSGSDIVMVGGPRPVGRDRVVTPAAELFRAAGELSCDDDAAGAADQRAGGALTRHGQDVEEECR